MKKVLEYRQLFVGAATPTNSGTADGLPWKRTLTGGATAAVTASGLQLALSATDEVQLARVAWADVLGLPIDRLIDVEILAGLSASIAAQVTAGIGVGTAVNATLESLTAFALHKAVGNNNLVISTDDNVIDNTDVATGMTWPTTPQLFRIDFATGVQSNVGRLSKGGKANVLFDATDTTGVSRRCAASTLFDMSNYSSGLQPYFQLQKSGGTGTATLTILEFCARYRAE